MAPPQRTFRTNVAMAALLGAAVLAALISLGMGTMVGRTLGALFVSTLGVIMSLLFHR